MEDQQRRPRDWRKVLKDEVIKFFSESPIPGLKYVVEGRSLFERMTWAVFIVTLFSIAINVNCSQFEKNTHHQQNNINLMQFYSIVNKSTQL